MYGRNKIRTTYVDMNSIEDRTSDYLYISSISMGRNGSVLTESCMVGLSRLEEDAMLFSDTGYKIIKYLSKDTEREAIPCNTPINIKDMLVPTCISTSRGSGYLHIDVIDNKLIVEVVPDKRDASLLFREEWEMFIEDVAKLELVRNLCGKVDFIMSTDILNNVFILAKDKQYVFNEYTGINIEKITHKEDITYCRGTNMCKFFSFEEALKFKRLDEDLEIRALHYMR